VTTQPATRSAASAFDRGMWLFTRLSALALVVMAAISAAVALYLGARTQLGLVAFMRWSFFPNPNHVIDTNIPDVTVGWSNRMWQAFGALIVCVAWTHGANGLRMVLEDYVSRRRMVMVLRAIILALWVVGLYVAVAVVLAS
jgi:succinate dehydrogenase hydrophobic anchor subunit